jgi:BirA family biotin operon repressor/biotin-[acetyl-CoA-carboxylase] ligase
MENFIPFQKLFKVKDCDSTQVLVKSYLALNSFPSILVQADFQTGGKGQSDNRWESEAYLNLLFSYNLQFVDYKIINQFYISSVVSLSLVKLFKTYMPQQSIRIKWPNDIYVGDHKIAGILIEHTSSADRIMQTIVGIGINVNQTIFSTQLLNPLSMKMITSIQYSIEELLLEFMTIFKDYFQKLQPQYFDTIRSEYLQYLYRHNQIAPYLIDGQRHMARINGIDEFGFLILDIEGVNRTFDIKELVYLSS